ncbi:MAG TPA: hypothetical protein VE778_02995 [Candidatus Bathyarchaeia archaeon]|jgi:hypothetical protein|nr:hypothetical protein [Candidatus Bathyarchaeia archaeon]
MNKHPYLRAYLAGIAVPTPLLLIAMTGYTVFRLIYHFPVPVERFIVFPMAVVPNLWGLWNILFIAWRRRVPLSLGLHGALLPILLGPLGLLASTFLKFSIPGFAAHVFPVLAPAALILYYFAWKYLVGFLNRVLEIG